MATLKEPKSLIESAYLTKGTIGNVGMPGAPIAHFSLVVNAASGTVSGMVEITQAIDSAPIEVKVTGTVRATGFGEVTKIVSLSGEYVVSVPPPAIGSYLQKFEAHMDINNEWNGTGGFSYGSHNINNVPVKSEN
jgi:hypothetical protein